MNLRKWFRRRKDDADVDSSFSNTYHIWRRSGRPRPYLSEKVTGDRFDPVAFLYLVVAFLILFFWVRSVAHFLSGHMGPDHRRVVPPTVVVRAASGGGPVGVPPRLPL